MAKKSLRGQLFLPSPVRWRRIIRNCTIRNRDSRRLVFLNFLLRVKESVNSDCRFGFLVKNCIYGQLDMSRVQKNGPKIRKSETLTTTNAISYDMSPPYKFILYLKNLNLFILQYKSSNCLRTHIYNVILEFGTKFINLF